MRALGGPWDLEIRSSLGFGVDGMPHAALLARRGSGYAGRSPLIKHPQMLPREGLTAVPPHWHHGWLLYFLF